MTSRGDRDQALVRAARAAGVRDRRVLAAMRAVPRARFLPDHPAGEVAQDRPVPIGAGQTTSQPSLIAVMLAALELTGDERVLEVGTGFGYQTALLAHLAGEIHTIERIGSLAEHARRHLAAIGLGDVEVTVGDGTRGLPAHAPYDAIVVSAAAERLPDALAAQLAEGGRLVAPLGPEGAQEVRVLTRRGGALVHLRTLSPVRFVPLIADPDPPA